MSAGCRFARYDKRGLGRQSDGMQRVENKVAVGLRHRWKTLLHLSHRELGILLPQGSDAAASFRLSANQQVGRAHGSMNPGRRWMFDQRTLLPTGCLDIVARSKMRAAHSHHAIECERVVRCEIKRNLEALDGGFGIALVD